MVAAVAKEMAEKYSNEKLEIKKQFITSLITHFARIGVFYINVPMHESDAQDLITWLKEEGYSVGYTKRNTTVDLEISWS